MRPRSRVRIPSLPNNAPASPAPLPNSRGNWGTWLSEFAALFRGDRVIGREVTIRAANGVRLRVDLVVRNMFTGRVRFIEAKFGPTSRFTEPNQVQGYPSILQNGGTIATDALAPLGLPRGTPVNPVQLLFNFWTGANPILST